MDKSKYLKYKHKYNLLKLKQIGGDVGEYREYCGSWFDKNNILSRVFYIYTLEPGQNLINPILRFKTSKNFRSTIDYVIENVRNIADYAKTSIWNSPSHISEIIELNNYIQKINTGIMAEYSRCFSEGHSCNTDITIHISILQLMNNYLNICNTLLQNPPNVSMDPNQDTLTTEQTEAVRVISHIYCTIANAFITRITSGVIANPNQNILKQNITLYRGMSFQDEKEFFEVCKINDSYITVGITSFTEKIDTAKQFSIDSGKPYKVLIQLSVNIEKTRFIDISKRNVYAETEYLMYVNQEFKINKPVPVTDNERRTFNMYKCEDDNHFRPYDLRLCNMENNIIVNGYIPLLYERLQHEIESPQS